MSSRLFVGNLPFDATEKEIRALFESAGHKVVSVKIVANKETGRSRGFAFADLEDEEAAKAAIGALNGKDFKGRPLVVNEARERGGPGRPGAEGGRFSGGGSSRRGGARGRGSDSGRWSRRGGRSRSACALPLYVLRPLTATRGIPAE